MRREPKVQFGRNDVEILDSTVRYAGFMQIACMRVRCRLFQGGWSQEFTREVMLRDPGVGVLLYDPVLDKVLLVEQFRIGCLDDQQNGPWALELVAGLRDTSESPEAVAIREVEEEAGLVIRELLPVCEYYNSPGGSAEKLGIYCAAFDATRAGGIFGLDAESENIRTVILHRLDAFEAVQSGRINNAMSIIALQWLQLNLEQIRTTLARGIHSGDKPDAATSVAASDAAVHDAAVKN